MAPAGAVISKKHNKDLIKERREQVAALMDKGMTSPSRIAKGVGVSEETIRRDVKAIRLERKSQITRKAGPEQTVDILGKLDEISRSAMADYIGLKDNSPRANAVKASLLQTSLRAVLGKAQFLQQTGVIPQDVTAVDRLLDQEVSEDRIKHGYDDELAAVIGNSESRRKVMDVMEQIKTLTPEMATELLDELDNPESVPELPPEEKGKDGNN